MSKASRVIGHGIGGFFIVFGLSFMFLGLNDGFTGWLDENSTCQSGACANDNVKVTFLILGGSFFMTGLITSLGTELAVRKTQRLVQHVTEFRESGSLDSMGGLSEFLKPFGVTIEPGSNADTNVQHRTIDLRHEREGDMPTDPAGLSNYLSSLGIKIDEAALRNATVVQDGEVVMAPEGSPVGVRRADNAESRDGRRESATIVRKKDRGETAGSQRLLELDLEVRPAGRAPYRVQVASLVRESLAGLLIEGSTLNVRVDSADENNVTIDWSEN